MSQVLDELLEELDRSQGAPAEGEKQPDRQPAPEQGADPRAGAFEQLQKEAGSRGFTFAGRVVQPGESLEEVMKRVPAGELESGGQMSTALTDLAGAKALMATLVPTGPKAKELIESLAKVAPKVVKAAQDTARQALVAVTEGMPAKGAVGVFRPMGKAGGSIDVSSLQSDKELLKTLLHEKRHFLNVEDIPKLLSANPSHQTETAEQISNMLSPREKNAAMMYANKAAGAGALNRPEFPYLANLALDESLAYGTEALLSPAAADPMLERILGALGFGIK